MISLEDCVGLSGLTEEEVLAIAEHEHIPEIAASALGQYLSRQERGSEQIRDMIVDDIRQDVGPAISAGVTDVTGHTLPRSSFFGREPAMKGRASPSRDQRGLIGQRIKSETDHSSAVCKRSCLSTAKMISPINSPMLMFRNTASSASWPIMS